ncbi:MAG: dTMP kinase [Pseudomonadota bacterium]
MFITFEGIEGCGKTTQITRLARRLEGYRIPFIKTFEPGGTGIGKTIRQILLDSRNVTLSPLAELSLYAADRAQHVEEVIEPALCQGKWVLCDRFMDATVAYQGIARGLDMSLIKILNERVTKGIRPDITFLMDCPEDVGLERALKRNRLTLKDDQDRFEKEEIHFHKKVREGYLQLARNDSKRVVVMDANLAAEVVEENIFQHIRPYIGA